MSSIVVQKQKTINHYVFVDYLFISVAKQGQVAGLRCLFSFMNNASAMRGTNCRAFYSIGFLPFNIELYSSNKNYSTHVSTYLFIHSLMGFR